MATAYVLVNTEIGSEEEVLKDLRALPEIKEAHVVYGVYDIITRIQAETMEELKGVVTAKIRRMDKIRSTLTMIIVE